MSSRLARGILSISIDVDAEPTRGQTSAGRRREEWTLRVLDLLGTYDVPATWALAEPATSPASREVAARAGHEIALAADGSWCGEQQGRGRFADELARRTAAAATAGLSIATLVLQASGLGWHHDLAIRQGIAAVRQAVERRVARAGRGPSAPSMRQGLWSFPVSLSLPGESRWMLGGGGGRRAQAVIDWAVAERGCAHLAIDVNRLAERGRASQRVLKRVIQHAQWRRRQGTLEIATVGAVAESLSSQHQAQPSRSILRPAA